MALAAVLVAVPALAAAQDADRFAKVQIKVTPVAGTVYMLEGTGGNIAASVGNDGIVIVDDQFAPLVDRIRAARRGVTDKPVRFVLNTHFHGDHTGGNALLQKEAPVIAHDNVRKRLAAGGGGGDAKPAEPGALPILTFGRDVTIHLNGEDVRALGPVSTLDDVRRFLSMVRNSRAAVEQALAAGKTPAQVKAEGVLDPWKSYSGDFISTDRWIETLVTELTGRPAGEFVKHD